MWAVDLGKFVGESFFKQGDEPEDSLCFVESVNIQIKSYPERCSSLLNVFTCLLRIVETANAVSGSGFPISWQRLKYKPECEQGRNWRQLIQWNNWILEYFIQVICMGSKCHKFTVFLIKRRKQNAHVILVKLLCKTKWLLHEERIKMLSIRNSIIKCLNGLQLFFL